MKSKRRLSFAPLARQIARARHALGNRLRLRHRTGLDYITFILPDTLPALPEQRGWLMRRLQGEPPLSLWAFDRAVRQIAADPRPRGVILMVGSLRLSLADLQTLRASIVRLRASGKRVVCYAQMYGMAEYFIASAASDIVLQPGGELVTLGLREAATYFSDSLEMLGVKLDVVAISPYKGGYDQFSRTTPSPEAQAQLEWLLDSRFRQMTRAMAEGRGWADAQVERLIDDAPHLDQAALAAGYVDGVMNEEGLPAYLEVAPKQLATWEAARRRLLVALPTDGARHVALLSVSGLMIPGESGRPPGGVPLPIPFIGGRRAGDRTVVRQIRHLMQRDAAAAVVVLIDSGGGAAIAAEAMTAALDALAQTRPVVAYLNSVAASGGYYLATAAAQIVAQPGTITGSIGVLTAKPVTAGLLERLRARRYTFVRGANADLYSDTTRFSERQRERVQASIAHIYRLFVERVARSRRLTPEAVDAVGGGRVWTGEQALTAGLVDQLGGLDDALMLARQLAGLPDDAPVVRIEGSVKPLPPAPADALEPAAAALRYAAAGVQAVANGSPQVLTPFEWM